VHIQQVVLLNLGHAGSDASNPRHRIVVRAGVFVPLGREDLQGDGKREIVRTAPLAEKHYALPAGAQQPQQAMVSRPTQTLLINELFVAGQRFIGTLASGLTIERDCVGIMKECCGTHIGMMAGMIYGKE
jgi:hypothetical protein